MEIVTAHKGKAHITAEKLAELNRGIAGQESVVFENGEKFKAEIISNNLIKIRDGCGLMQGREVYTPLGWVDEVTIENGSQGKKRIDLIVVRYEKNPDTKIETTTVLAIKGEESDLDPVTPEHTKGNIKAGDMKADWPIYEVELDGITVKEVRPLFKVLMNMSTLNKSLSNIKDHIVESGKKKVGSRYYYYEKYASGKLVQWGVGSYSYTDGYGTIEYPVAFAGAVEDYCLFVQPRYIATKVIEVIVASKVTTAKGNVYARHLDYSKPDTHPFDWYAIGRWK